VTMLEVVFKHWKTEEQLKAVGTIVFNNPQSDRLVLKDITGKLQDILRSTIVEIKEYSGNEQ